MGGIRQLHGTECSRPATGCDCRWEADLRPRHDGRRTRRSFATEPEAREWREEALGASGRAAVDVSDSVLFFLQGKFGGPVAIAAARPSVLDKRLDAIRLSYPVPMRLTTLPGHFEDERRLLDHFKQAHLREEWFRPVPGLAAMCGAVPDSATLGLFDERVRPQFWAKVTLAPNGCWLWTGALAGPGEQYGYINIAGKIRRAHIVSYEALVGPIPAGLHLDHVRARGCIHRRCVNPAHLEPVTPRENGLRGRETPWTQNARKTHCVRGHPFDEENTAIYNGKRSCKQCNRDKANAYRRKRHSPGSVPD